MEVMDVVDRAREALAARPVFGQPYERDGVTVIPVASIRGAAGGGGGEGPSSEGGSGRGTGFGFKAWPVGAYVIREGKVAFRPAIDVGKLVGRFLAGTFAVALLAVLLEPKQGKKEKVAMARRLLRR